MRRVQITVITVVPPSAKSGLRGNLIAFNVKNFPGRAYPHTPLYHDVHTRIVCPPPPISNVFCPVNSYTVGAFTIVYRRAPYKGNCHFKQPFAIWILVNTLHAWTVNSEKRLVKNPKPHSSIQSPFLLFLLFLHAWHFLIYVTLV